MNEQDFADILLPQQTAEPTKMIPTGTPFVDELLGGGLEPGQVYAILGPTGVGKSTMMSRVAVGAAWHFAQHDTEKVAVQFHMEMPHHLSRAINASVAVRVDRTAVQRGVQSGFSRSDCLKLYENDAFFWYGWAPWHRESSLPAAGSVLVNWNAWKL